MTVTSNPTRNDYTSTANQSVFAYSFKIVTESDIKVIVGGVVKTLTSDYTVSGVNSPTGGNVTLNAGISAGITVSLIGDMELDRDADYQNNGAFLASDVNGDFDRLWIATNQQETSLSRAITAPEADVLSSGAMVIPSISARQGKILRFDDITGDVNVVDYDPNILVTPSSVTTFTNKSGNISQWTNDSGYTTNAGDITSVVAGTGLSGGATSGSATLNIDSTVATLTGAQTLTNKSGNISQWTNDSGYTTNTGDITAVVAGTALSGGATSGSATLNVTDNGIGATQLNVSGDGTSGQVLASDGDGSFSWVAQSGGGGGISLTDLSATVASAGTANLVYNNTNGVFTYTPPDLSSYVTASGTTFTGNVIFNDNVKALFGTSSDFEIFHNGSDTVFKDSGSGILKYSSLNDTTAGAIFQIENTSTQVASGSFVEFKDNLGFTPVKIGGVGAAFSIIVQGDEELRVIDGETIVRNALKVNNTASTINSGSGAPEGTLSAAVGSLYMRTDGGADTSLYVKESGSGNTGWVAGSGGNETLAQTLAIGNTTGGTDLSVSSGDNIVMATSSTVDGRDVSVDGTKLDGIEASADVTDTANVTAAGALMDSELTAIASVKALNQGVATTDSPAFAGLTVDTTTLAVDSTNNRVGIGTSSPSEKLEIQEGNISVKSSTISQETPFYFMRDDSGQTADYVASIGMQAASSYDWRGVITFNTKSGSAYNNTAIEERMRITADGVVEFKAGITEDAVTLTGTSTTIDLATATNFTHTLTGATTYTFSNPATTGNATAFTLKVIQDSTARTITWPASVDWAGGTAPTLTATSGGVDVFVFYTIDGGTTYYGFTAGQAMA
jgi:hypothetical protein